MGGINLLNAFGQAKPVSEFINTAQTYQANERQGRIQEMQLTELQRKQEDEGRLIDLEDIPTRFATIGQGEMGKALKAYAESLAPLHEVPAPDGTVKRFIRKGDLMNSMKDQEALIKAAPNHAMAITWGSYLDKKARLSALQADQAKGKPVSPEALATAQREADEVLKGYTEYKRALEGKDPIKPNVYKPGDFVEQPGGGFMQMPKEPEPTKTRTIKEGDIERTEEWVNGAWVPIATAPRYKPTTNVITNVNTGSLEKGARAKAQEEVQEGTDLYTGLQRVIELSKPEYFTYAGQIQAKAEKIGEKAGMVKDPAMLGGYSAWKVGVEQEFNKYRKWITGVAAGPQELELIRQTFPNKDMSETEFKAAARQTAITTWKLVERRRRALAAGIMDESKQKEFYRLLPLDAMPNPPADFLGRFSGGVPSDLPPGTVDNGDGTFTLPTGKRVRPKR